MEELLKQKCDLIVANREKYKKKMFWEIDSADCAVMAALISASLDMEADADKYTECKKLLRKTVSFLSEFRGIAESMVITKMTTKDDPEEFINGAIEVYKKLKALHAFSASPYLVMAAINIYEAGGEAAADENIEKLEELYKGIKKDHPLLVSGRDRGYISMLILLGVDIEKTIKEIADCYEACRQFAFDKDAVHSLAQILALSTKSVEEKSSEVKEMLDLLKANKKPISKGVGLSSLGIMPLLNTSVEDKVSLISEVDDYLKTQNGFKWYQESGRIRRVYACLIIFMTYAKDQNEALSSVISSTLTMTLIEEIIMLLLASNVAVSTAASSSSSN